MKAAIIEEFGGPEKLKIADVSIPKPADHEIQIQTAYAAVNPVDWKIREGLFKTHLPFEFPIILGWDVAGTVVALGTKVQNFKIGDQVFAYCRKPTIKWGTYAELVNVDADHVALKPKIMTFAEAASIPLAALTAWQALFEEGKLKKNDIILIHAGAGGVGGFAIQLSKINGAVVCTTASQYNHVYVSKLGAGMAIDYTKHNFVEKIKQKYPQGIDIVLDCVGGKTLKDSLDVLKPGGRVVSIVEQIDPSQTLAKGVKGGFVFVRPDGNHLREITKLINTGKMVAPNIEEMRLEDVQKAQEKVRAGHTKGKIVLKVR